MKTEPVSLEDWLSPHGLKMIVDSSPKDRKAFRSYAFGVIKQIKAKWVWIMIIAVVAIGLVLYATGVVRF